MNNAILENKAKRRLRRDQTGMPYKKDRWPLYTGISKEPTPEEFAEKIKSLSDSDIKRIMMRAGIIDRDGNLNEIYRP